MLKYSNIRLETLTLRMTIIGSDFSEMLEAKNYVKFINS